MSAPSIDEHLALIGHHFSGCFFEEEFSLTEFQCAHGNAPGEYRFTHNKLCIYNYNPGYTYHSMLSTTRDRAHLDLIMVSLTPRVGSLWSGWFSSASSECWKQIFLNFFFLVCLPPRTTRTKDCFAFCTERMDVTRCCDYTDTSSQTLSISPDWNRASPVDNH